MKRLLRFTMRLACTCEEYSRSFVALAGQSYSDEIHGIGRIE